MGLLAGLGALRHLSPADKAVQEKIAALRDFITANYYTCSTEILAQLGQMYVEDPRFQRTIDHAGGEGAARFISQAIEVYCAQNSHL